jgi:tetratricopeptide (TPR) repeat protein
MILDKTDSTNFAKQQYITWLSKLDSASKVKQALEVETAIGNIAFLYQKAKNYEMASVYYGKVLDLKANSFATINKILDPAGKTDSSTIFTAEFVNLLGQTESLENNVRIGYVAMKLKNFETAAEYYNKAEVLAPENKDISKMRALCDDYATYLRIDDTKTKLDSYLSKMKERDAKKKAALKK